MQFDRLKRREFITLLGGGAIAWPLPTRAQQHPPMGVPAPSTGARQQVIGFLHDVLSSEYGFRRGLSDMGFVEGTNVVIDYRSATSQIDRLPAMAADLVSRNVAVIVSIDSDRATQAAMAATQSIPIVFTTAGNPVQLGFVASLNRPGGNLTGVSTIGSELVPKRLELLRELLPTARKIALLLTPNSSATSQLEVDSAKAAASRLGLEIIVVSAGTERIGNRLGECRPTRVAALLVTSDVSLSSRHEYIGVLARRHALPSISNDRLAVVAGQLMSYASNSEELYRLAGSYVGRVLKGQKPADLPVVQPTKFELAVNLKTAKAIGLTIPESFLLRADEVIE